jgi:hypothetical protein
MLRFSAKFFSFVGKSSETFADEEPSSPPKNIFFIVILLESQVDSVLGRWI